LLAATLYEGNLERNHKLWNIVSTEIYTPYAGAAGILLVKTYNFISKDIQICLKKKKIYKLFVCGFKCVFIISLKTGKTVVKSAPNSVK
jgi:hypothetical protein